MSGNFDETPLPRPTVKYRANIEQLDEATTLGMMSNPIYVGVPPYRRVVSDETWVRAATELIKEQGPEQFLVNMLHVLRASLVDAVPDEAIPEDYDGPWPADDLHPPDQTEDEDWFEDDDAPSPWRYPLEGFLYCSHDDLPMILLDDEFVCVSEYLLAHINGAPINDLITEPTLTLVFQNGHTLPLLCPDCGQSVHEDDYNELLEAVNGLTIVGLEWDDDLETLVLVFGHSLQDEEEVTSLEVHLNSIRGLTCPHQDRWHSQNIAD